MLALQALPIILVMSVLTTLLFYWRILPPIVRGFSWVLERTLGVGGAVGLATAANIFLGQVESPLFIRPYLARLTRSELFLVMTGGMAGIAGTVLVIYATMLGPLIPDAAVHLVIASVLGAPARRRNGAACSRRRGIRPWAMPISATPDSERRWLVARAGDVLSLADTLDFLRTARTALELRMWPLLVDARGCRTTMTVEDVDAAVALVRSATEQGQRRGHVTLIADDPELYRWFLLYETRCASIGAGIIRAFTHYEEAVQWLEIVSAAREFS